MGASGAPVHNPTSGPVFRQAPYPIRRVYPPLPVQAQKGLLFSLTRRGPPGTQNVSESYSSGRVSSSRGAPVNNPTIGNPVLPAGQPAGVLVTYIRTGNVLATQISVTGSGSAASFFPRNMVRARIVSNSPRAGITVNELRPGIGSLHGPLQGAGFGSGMGSGGAPVNNPSQGPVFRSLRWPVQAQDPLVSRYGSGPRGRVYGISKGAPVPVVPAVAPFRPQGLVRARVAFNYPRAGSVTNELSFGTGNIGSPVQGAGFGNGQGANGAPVRNPTVGPVFRQVPRPVQAAVPLPRRGRVYGVSYSGAPVRNPTAGPVFRQLPWPVQAVDPLPRRGRVYGVNTSGAPVQNPTSGPPFRQAIQPARARQPLPARGRVQSAAGTLVILTAGVQFYPARQPIRARVPQNAPRGRVYGNQGGPVRNPTQGPVFRQATQPVKARQPFPPRGRAASLNGQLVILTAGVQFYPAREPIRAGILQNAPRGRVYSNPGAPVHNPTTGPVFTQAVQPVRTRLPLPGKGRAGSNPGTVTFPAVVTPAPLHPQGVVRARVPQPVRGGRTWSGRGAPVVIPAVFYPAVQPVRARLPVPFLKGRVYGNPGVFAPSRGPVFRLAVQAARIRPVLPPRGRTGSNPGVLPPPVIIPAVFRPAVQVIRARQPLPLRGRVVSNPGGKVKNPTSGPRFVQAVQPARKRIPANTRGRVYGNPGAPVQNVPINRVLFTVDMLFVGYPTGDLFTGYGVGDVILLQFRTGQVTV